MASLKYFDDKQNKTVFIKSVKYKEAIQLSWNGEEDENIARFQMIIGDDNITKCNITHKWVSDMSTIEFKFIYFYSANDDDRYLSVTPLSPAWLPSLTKKDKSVTNLKTTSQYIRKSSEKLDNRVCKFLLPLFLQEKNFENENVEFITDYKKSILELLQENDFKKKITLKMFQMTH